MQPGIVAIGLAPVVTALPGGVRHVQTNTNLRPHIGKARRDERLPQDLSADTEDDRLLVRLNFIHLPTLEVEEQDRTITADNFSYEFSSGRSLHFSMKADQLIGRMARTHLRIGVYRKADRFPICYASTHLYGCVCDLVAQSIEEGTPFELKGPFTLVDPGKSVAGRVDLDIYLRSLGRHSITQYALGPDHFLVKSERCAAEYKCAVDGTSEMTTLPSREENHLDVQNFIKDIAGIAPVAGRLASGRPRKPARLSVEIIAEVPRTSKKKKSGKKKKKKKKKKK